MSGSGTLRAAVIGVGALGRWHAQKYATMEGVELRGVADVDPARAAEIASAHSVTATRDFTELLPHVDVVSVVVPTEAHYGVARVCLEAGVHVLIEKPISRSTGEADALIALAEASRLELAVGHLERFNPAVLALTGLLERPLFVEAERLGGFKGRGTDVDVVLDLMIHDIDLVLSMMPAPLISVSACGFQVLTDHVDIANARLEFADGAVADLSASRVSRSPVRKLRVFAPHFYASADLQIPELRVERRPERGGSAVRTFEGADALRAEIEAFVAAVRGQPARAVSAREARDALAIALDVNQAVLQRLARFSGALSGTPS